ncbi:MAG: EF-hand domain-containing protein [Pseudomonadota bacterium]
MMKLLNDLALACGLGVLAALAANAVAAEPPSTHADPYVPPAQRLPSAEPPASGEDLYLQALVKLKHRFDQADLDGSGSLTLEEANKAGLGYVVEHFDEIDTAHLGKITFEDLRKYMAMRRREALAEKP